MIEQFNDYKILNNWFEIQSKIQKILTFAPPIAIFALYFLDFCCPTFFIQIDPDMYMANTGTVENIREPNRERIYINEGGDDDDY